MSGYAKALEGVMRLFPRKIKVTFIDADTGMRLGESKMFAEQLPEKFNKPTVIEAMGRKWRVLDADPKKADDFVYTRKLLLTVVDSSLARSANGRFYVASIADGLPETVEESLFRDFIIEIPLENWRQIELLPASMLQQVQEEVSVINSILHPAKKYNRLMGYERMHIREKIEMRSNNIGFDKFCGLVNVLENGAVRIFVNEGRFVSGGFALRSFNYEYYGVMEDGIIKSLCLKEFDCADDELLTVLSAFGLVLVVWCEGTVISAELKEGGEGEIDLAGAGGATDAILT